ncbi:dipeptide ABC transporter ATP-binding protein [Brachybacterium subflavum]|uniref:dipeptide ABC transporter ATP-binding protein n=1 Tax=Brachybacterium subflavum TaxID=2585206 RepID=UPI0012662119|nr:ABC transporter ATP-binding protein [Brachybacterium subflavum]
MSTRPDALEHGDEDSAAVLEIADLRVRFETDEGEVLAVDGASFEVHQAEVAAVVGESGSGKSMTAMSILGIAPEDARITGSIRVRGADDRLVEVLGDGPSPLPELRGRRVSMIFQDPTASLDPVFSIGFQLAEVVRRAAPGTSRREVRERSLELLREVDIPDPEGALRRYPHQLSGGQCQRVMIAMALASRPDLLIADEPTTALDVTVQAEVLDVLRRLRESTGTAVLLITHDMGVVADLADAVVVLKDGKVVEQGPVREVLGSPREEYTRTLLEAVPRLEIDERPGREPAPQREPGGEDPGTTECPSQGATGDSHEGASRADAAGDPDAALSIRDLCVDYGRGARRSRAVDGVGLDVAPGEILGLVGESGSGKTTIGRAIVGLVPVAQGSILVEGRDVVTAGRADRRAMRRRVGVVFQSPRSSLNPRYTVERTVTEPLVKILGLSSEQLEERTSRLLAGVGLDDSWRHRRPHQLSGGQCQRVAIARALALDPALLIADEPTSALDVSVQAQVLDVFRELQESLGFGCLFITHDLAVVDQLCGRVAVMRSGALVETDDSARVLHDPHEEYTRRLIAAAPVADPDLQAERRARRAAA